MCVRFVIRQRASAEFSAHFWRLGWNGSISPDKGFMGFQLICLAASG
jgi:hypothetical protein